MRRSARAALVLATVIFPLVVGAQAPRVVEVNPARSDGWLVVDVRGADLIDDRTRSTIESGLPGSCLLQLRLLLDGRRATAEREVQRSLELDLWDGRVWMREGDDETAYPGLAAADSAFARFDAIRLLPLDELMRSARYAVEARLVVSPLAPEDRERVHRWVSRSRSEGGDELSLDLSGLVRHFVGGEDDEAGGDAIEARSTSFGLDDLGERPRP